MLYLQLLKFWKSFLFVFIFSLFIQLNSEIIWWIFNTSENPFSSWVDSLLALLSDFLNLIIILILLINRKIILKGIITNNFNLKQVGIGIGTGLILLLFIKPITIIYGNLIDTSYVQKDPSYNFDYSHLPVLFSYIIVTPVYEEFFFRGFIQNGLGNRYKLIWAILMSAILFGLFHLPNHYQAFLTTFYGLGLGLAYSKSKNILTPISAHITINLLVMTSLYTKIFFLH